MSSINKMDLLCNVPLNCHVVGQDGHDQQQGDGQHHPYVHLLHKGHVQENIENPALNIFN